MSEVLTFLTFVCLLIVLITLGFYVVAAHRRHKMSQLWFRKLRSQSDALAMRREQVRADVKQMLTELERLSGEVSK